VLHRTAGRPQLRTVDRVLLATASRAIPRDRWVAFLVTPSTLLRWHRELVKLLGRKTRPCTQVGEVTFDGARPDAHEISRILHGAASGDEGGQHVHLTLGRARRECAAQVSVSHARCLAAAASQSSRLSMGML
jgi:hypothetical protein